MIFILNLLDVILISLLFYYIYVFFRHNKVWQIIRGVFFCLIITVLSAFLKLEVLGWVLRNIWTVSILALIIIFQPEIRAIFAEMGRHSFFHFIPDIRKNTLDILVDTIQVLSQNKTGALIVIGRNDNLKSFIDNGVKLNSIISKELLLTIFKNGTELHDGAVILESNKIASASSILPLTNKEFSDTTGTRHRAGIGMSEATDAIVIIVSEETGNISIAYNGNIIWGVNLDYLRNFLYSLTNKNNSNKTDLFVLKIKNLLSLNNIKNNFNIKLICLLLGFIFWEYTKYFVVKS